MLSAALPQYWQAELSLANTARRLSGADRWYEIVVMRGQQILDDRTGFEDDLTINFQRRNAPVRVDFLIRRFPQIALADAITFQFIFKPEFFKTPGYAHSAAVGRKVKFHGNSSL